MVEGQLENTSLSAEAREGILSKQRPGAFSGSRGTILLVEDDEAIREVEMLLLATMGYTIISATSGAAAVEIFRTAQGSIDILLTDIVMPGMTGTQLARLLQGFDPDLKVVFMSGYTAGALADDPAASFVQKPFTRDMLAGKLREAMRSRATARAAQ